MRTLLCCALLMMAGCATRPSDIQGKYVSGRWFNDASYDTWEVWRFSCGSTHELLADVDRHYGVWTANALNRERGNYDAGLYKEYSDGDAARKAAEEFILLHKECPSQP